MVGQLYGFTVKISTTSRLPIATMSSNKKPEEHKSKTLSHPSHLSRSHGTAIRDSSKLRGLIRQQSFDVTLHGKKPYLIRLVTYTASEIAAKVGLSTKLQHVMHFVCHREGMPTGPDHFCV